MEEEGSDFKLRIKGTSG